MNDVQRTTACELEYVDCPVCGPAPCTTWMDDGKPTRYIRCQTCRTVYASPRAARTQRYAWLEEAFGVGAGAFRNAAGRRPALWQEAEIIKRLVRGGRMLDIGCDLGIFFERFAGPMWQRFGVEVSPSAADYAARTYAAQVFAGTSQQAAFPADYFDLVTMIDMLYHVDDPRAELQEAARILKPGGLLAIELAGQGYQLVRSRGPFCLLLEGRWTRLHTDSSHLFWFDPQGLRRLLEACGFAVVGVHVIGSPRSSSVWRNRLASAYYQLLRMGSRLSPRLLNWSPKYLMLAQRKTAL